MSQLCCQHLTAVITCNVFSQTLITTVLRHMTTVLLKLRHINKWQIWILQILLSALEHCLENIFSTSVSRYAIIYQYCGHDSSLFSVFFKQSICCLPNSIPSLTKLAPPPHSCVLISSLPHSKSMGTYCTGEDITKKDFGWKENKHKRL